MITGGGRGWDRPLVVTGLTVGALGLAAFVLWERQASAPMLPLRLLRHRGFVTAGVASLLMYSVSFGTLFLLTQLLQTSLGAGLLEAGLRTLPMAVMPVFLAPDRMLIFGERHLRKMLAEYCAHYNTQRPHRALQLRPPHPESAIPDPVQGRIRRRPILGGLINTYKPAA